MVWFGGVAVFEPHGLFDSAVNTAAVAPVVAAVAVVFVRKMKLGIRPELVREAVTESRLWPKLRCILSGLSCELSLKPGAVP